MDILAPCLGRTKVRFIVALKGEGNAGHMEINVSFRILCRNFCTYGHVYNFHE
jgi:hypothetical protein